MNKLEELGVTEIEIDTREEFGSSFIDIKAFKYREETDEEYNNRINAQKERQERIKRLELEELKRLKTKYGI